MRAVASAVAAAVAVTLVAGVAATPLAAQEDSPRDPPVGSVLGKPRLMVSAGVSNESQAPGIKSLQTRDGTITTGSTVGVGTYVAIGLAIPVATSALELRLEGLWNQFRDDDGRALTYPVGEPQYMATSERVMGGLATLAWEAFPRRSFTPYLLTGLGYYHSRLEREPRGGDMVRLAASSGNIGRSFGLGVRMPVAGRALLLELRQHWIAEDEPVSGTDFLPLTIGARF